MTNLRVLHLFDNYLPHTENWIYRLMTASSGCEIFVGANHYLKNNFYDTQFKFIDHHMDDMLRANRESGKLRWSNLIRKIMLQVFLTIFNSPRQVFSRTIKLNNIQLVHCHFANVGWMFRNVVRSTNTPLVISFYGWDYEKLPFTRPEYKKRFKTLFQRAAAFICEGKHGAAILKKQGCPQEKIHIVKLGIELSKIPFIKRSKNKNQLRLLQVASFTEKKGQKYAMEAVAKALQDCPDIELTFIGGDSNSALKSDLMNRVEDLQLANHIRFLPAIPYKHLYQSFEDYDVFIHPSCYAPDMDCEGGAPVVLLDAQATGMPVIATTHCDIPEEVIHKETGLLSPEKDLESLVKNIKAFYKMDTKTYNEFARHARKHVETNYNIEKSALSIQKVYRKIISSK